MPLLCVVSLVDSLFAMVEKVPFVVVPPWRRKKEESVAERWRRKMEQREKEATSPYPATSSDNWTYPAYVIPEGFGSDKPCKASSSKVESEPEATPCAVGYVPKGDISSIFLC